MLREQIDQRTWRAAVARASTCARATSEQRSRYLWPQHGRHGLGKFGPIALRDEKTAPAFLGHEPMPAPQRTSSDDGATYTHRLGQRRSGPM
jgi:hypothetical protein